MRLTKAKIDARWFAICELRTAAVDDQKQAKTGSQ